MSAANVRLQLQFDLELAVPASVAALDHARLCQKLAELLGPTVIQGLPVIAGKQLAKAEVRVVKHHHRLDAVARAVARIEPARIVEAAPHLTDAEVERVSVGDSGRFLPEAPGQKKAYSISPRRATIASSRSAAGW